MPPAALSPPMRTTKSLSKPAIKSPPHPVRAAITPQLGKHNYTLLDGPLQEFFKIAKTAT
jgi:hypothetical protein